MSLVRAATRFLARLISEDNGQDLVEYALLSVAAGGLAIYATLQSSMATAYINWNTGVRNAWEPCAPGQTPGSTCF